MAFKWSGTQDKTPEWSLYDPSILKTLTDEQLAAQEALCVELDRLEREALAEMAADEYDDTPFFDWYTQGQANA